MNSDSVNSRGSTPAAVMAARRLVLLLMMMTVTGVVAAEASTTVTDRELAKVVVEKTSKFLEGPTGRALTIQDRFQGWINSLELQISELAYNAVNRAASAFSRIPFFETYFSQYQSPLPSLQREPPKSPPVLFIYPQSQQYLYHEDVQPATHDVREQSASHDFQQVEQNILDPDAVYDYQDYEDETLLYPKVISPQLSPYSSEPNPQAREHYLQSNDSSPHDQEHNPHGEKHYLQSQETKPQAKEPDFQLKDYFLQTEEPTPHVRQHYLQAQEPYPQLQKDYLQGQEPLQQAQKYYLQTQEQNTQSQEQFLSAQQKLQMSVQLQGFSPPKIPSPALQKNDVASGQQSPFVSPPPVVPQSPQLKSDVASPHKVFAHGQANDGSVQEAIKRLFTEDGGDSPSVQRQGAIEQPNVAGDGSYRDGPHYPDLVEGGHTLAPAAWFPPLKSPLRSDKEGDPSTKPSATKNLQKFTPDQYSSPLSAYNPSAPLPGYNPLQPFAGNGPTQSFSANNNLPLPSYRPTPRHANRTEGTAPEDLLNATDNPVLPTGQSRRRRSAWESFSIWNLFTDNSAPTALYCPSGGGKLLLCAGDQLFDEYVKAPIESAKDWVSNIDIHLYDN